MPLIIGFGASQPYSRREFQETLTERFRGLSGIFPELLPESASRTGGMAHVTCDAPLVCTQTMSAGGKLRALERWTLLGDTLAAAARCGPLPAMPAPPATPSSGNRAAAAAAAAAGGDPKAKKSHEQHQECHENVEGTLLSRNTLILKTLRFYSQNFCNPKIAAIYLQTFQ